MSEETTGVGSDLNEEYVNELSRLRQQWWVFLILGIALIVCGLASISYPFFATVGVMVFIGVTLMISGVAIMVMAFWTGRWSAFMLQFLCGLLYLVAGFIIADAPVASAALFTLMLAGFLVVAGIFRIVYSVMEKFPQWGWVLLNGIASLLLGLITFKSFRQFAEGERTTIFWILGIMVGIELLFYGWSWVALSFSVKNSGGAEAESDAS